ncbi:hypothetical protein L596_022500 [Steinernema carpocapsae]|uniref:Tyrosine-protein phosphatase domain-containing protein n=1 Tax=Steinernema carpocapsae TaxID=34508 RepID=A0A4U5MMR6_STECR|nr:hypothetical protein L596_022500 [Steinernema carpocapsae]
MSQEQDRVTKLRAKVAKKGGNDDGTQRDKKTPKPQIRASRAKKKMSGGENEVPGSKENKVTTPIKSRTRRGNNRPTGLVPKADDKKPGAPGRTIRRGGTVRRRNSPSGNERSAERVEKEDEKEMKTRVDQTVEESQVASGKSTYKKHANKASAENPKDPKESQRTVTVTAGITGALKKLGGKTLSKKKGGSGSQGRTNKQERSQTYEDFSEEDEKPQPQGNALIKELMKKWCERALTKGVQGLKAEFEELRKWTPENPAITVFSAHGSKNRYKDVTCLDETRVKLLNREGSDYIHANWVHTEVKLKRFICCQGPLPTTVNEFWHMLVHENVRVVVMLCNCVEKGSKKCEPYWPQAVGENLTLNDTQITATAITKLERAPSVQLTQVKVVPPDGKEYELRHYQWINWPDKGVPKSDDTVFQLLAAVRDDRNPIVVHCSAGIGRTGSVVLIEYVLEKINKRVDASDMGEMLKQLRRQRVQAVQTDMQYLYIHHAILRYFYQMRIIEKTPAFAAFTEEYEKLLAAATA